MMEVVAFLATALVLLAVIGVAGYVVLRWVFVRVSGHVSDKLAAAIVTAGTHAAGTRVGQRSAGAAKAAAERLTRLGVYAAAANIPEDVARRQFVESIERVARLMDGAVRLPLVGPVGLDALLGLIPVAGDAASAAVGLSLVARSLKYGVPPDLIARMLGNVLTDLLFGAIPIVGDLADLWFRANQRNTDLLRAYLASPVSEDRPS